MEKKWWGSGRWIGGIWIERSEEGWWKASPEKGRERPQKSRRTPLPVLDPIWTHHLFQSALSPNEAAFFFSPRSNPPGPGTRFFFFDHFPPPSLSFSSFFFFFLFLNSPRASFEWGEKVARVEESGVNVIIAPPDAVWNGNEERIRRPRHN